MRTPFLTRRNKLIVSVFTNSNFSKKMSHRFVNKKKLIKTNAKKRLPIKIEYEATENKTDSKNINVISVIQDVKNTNVENKILRNLRHIKTDKLEIRNQNIKQPLNMKDIKVKKKCKIGELAPSKNIESEKLWMPQNWETILKNIKEMRKDKVAPVDKMGCHKCADPNASASISRYQSLIALMLSSQTKDEVTYAAMQRLNSYGCRPDIIAAIPDDVLGKLIYPVGFWKRKMQYIKKTSVILLNKYNGDIPRTITELCDLPGVGPKMAHICMQIAWGEISGIGVDTHVHRICNRLGWVKETKTPEKTREELETWLPKPIWSEINYLLVGFGQQICLPRFPKCSDCLNRNICPYVTKNSEKFEK